MNSIRYREISPGPNGAALGPTSQIDLLVHEIRDPLTTIMASAELLERGIDSEARRGWLLEAILECAERIAVKLNEAQVKAEIKGRKRQSENSS